MFITFPLKTYSFYRNWCQCREQGWRPPWSAPCSPSCYSFTCPGPWRARGETCSGWGFFCQIPKSKANRRFPLPSSPPSLAGYPATTELSAIPTDFPTTCASGRNNHFWVRGWRAVIPNCWGPFLSLLIFVMQNQVRIAVSLKGSSPQKVRSLKSHILDSNGVWYSY